MAFHEIAPPLCLVFYLCDLNSFPAELAREETSNTTMLHGNLSNVVVVFGGSQAALSLAAA